MTEARGHTVVRRRPKDGTGVTVIAQTIKYAVADSGTVHPNSGWQDSVPSATNGKYIWTWIHIEYSDGSVTNAYSVSRLGIDGKGVVSSVTTYCQKANTNTSPENFPASDWGSFPSSLTDGYWLYTKTVVTYSDGDTTTSYSVVQIGQGSYYAGLQEYYAAFASADHSQISGYPDKYPSGSWDTKWPETYAAGETPSIDTTKWKTSRAAVTLNASTPYLWNFEISRDSQGNQYVTEPVCIGNFAKGITSIVEAYAISSQSVAPSGSSYPSDISTWTDEAHDAAPTTAKPYQWNRTIITYNDNSTTTTYHVSAVKGGKGDPGDDGVIRFLLPSTRQIMRYSDGTLSESTVSCQKYKQTGSALPVVASDCSMKYHYVEAGVTSSQISYSGGNITVGMWWTEVVFHLFMSGTEIATETVKILPYATSPGKNLLTGTNFVDEPSDTTTFADNKLVTRNALQGEASLSCIASPTQNSYIDFFRQVIHYADGRSKMEASTWYTMSFWARSRFVQIDVNTTSNAYGFATHSLYLLYGQTITMTIRGCVNSAAYNAGKSLRCFCFNSDWSWQASCAIRSTSTTEAQVSFTVPSHGTYQVVACVFLEPGGGNTPVSGQTATLEWYRISYSNPLLTYIYPGLIDTSAIQVVDGIRYPSSPSDGNVNWQLSSAWSYHTFSFKTKSTLPTSNQRALWRLPAGCDGVEICMPKLERGVMASSWQRAETDKTGQTGMILRTREWNNGGTGGITYHNDEDLETETRYLDIVTVTSGAGTFTAYKCKKTHTTTSSSPIAVTNTTYWEQMNSMEPIYTPLIMAAYGQIYFAQTNQLLVMKNDGSTVAAGMGGGDFPIWAGAVNPNNAPFRVSQAGVLRATGAYLEGEVHATRGEFTGELKGAFGSFDGGIFNVFKHELVDTSGYTIGASGSRQFPQDSHIMFNFMPLSSQSACIVEVPAAIEDWTGLEVVLGRLWGTAGTQIGTLYIQVRGKCFISDTNTMYTDSLRAEIRLQRGQLVRLTCVSCAVYGGMGADPMWVVENSTGLYIRIG